MRETSIRTTERWAEPLLTPHCWCAKWKKPPRRLRRFKPAAFVSCWAKPPGSLWSHQTGRVQAAVWPTSKNHVQIIFISTVTLIFWYMCLIKHNQSINTHNVLWTFSYFLHSLYKRLQELLYNMQVLELGSVGPVEITLIWSSADLFTWRGRFFTYSLFSQTLSDNHVSAVGSVIRSPAPFCLHHHQQWLNSISRVPVRPTSSWWSLTGQPETHERLFGQPGHEQPPVNKWSI